MALPDPPSLGEGVAGTTRIRIGPPNANGDDQRASLGSFSSGSSPSDDEVWVDKTSPGVANEEDELNDLDSPVVLVFNTLESGFAAAEYLPIPFSASSIRISLNASSASSNNVERRFSFTLLVNSRACPDSGPMVSSYSVFGDVYVGGMGKKKPMHSMKKHSLPVFVQMLEVLVRARLRCCEGR
jgi:hypothetical protein